MRILFLNKFYFLKGGSEKVFLEEYNLLRSAGHTVFPFSRQNACNDFSEYTSFFPSELPLSERGPIKSVKNAIDIIYSREAKKKCSEAISVMKPDIAHAHNIYGLLTTSVLDALHSARIPIILTLHDYKIICPNYSFLSDNSICEDCKTHRYYRAVTNKCVHGNFSYSLIYAVESYFNYVLKKYSGNVTKFIAVSKFTRNKFLEYGFHESQIDVIPNFINTNVYNPSYNNDKYFLYFGRLSKEKGVDILINAFSKMKQNRYRLIIAGEGPMLTGLQHQVSDNHLTNIEFTGFLSGERLSECVRKSAAVVVPSVCYENCPMSILEAMAFGKPVIGASIGGIPELIQDGIDGYLCTSGDAEDLLSKMTRFASLSDRESSQMGMAGRAKIEDHYSQDKHCSSLLSLYDMARSGYNG